jgi:putative heme transporter
VIPGTKTVPGPKHKWSVRWRKVRPYARIAFVIAAIALAWWVLSGHTAELAGASGYLTHIRWEWLMIGVVAELGSIVAYAVVQQRLLAAGNLHTGIRWLTGVTLANIAITNSLPTGSIIATIFTYRQYRHKGADEVLAAWAIVALLVVTSVTLAIVAAAGIGVAGSESSNLDLVGVTVGVLVLTLAVGALFVQRRALVWTLSKLVALTFLVLPRVGARADAIVKHFVNRLQAVSFSPLQMVVCMMWGLFNWVLDCGCLVFSFAALGVGVPWRGLLLAYGAGQLAANLPITPGGLGVVEGSITVALVYYGGAEFSTVAAVFLYRLISFWGELPIGWVAWAWLAARRRRTQARLRHDLPVVSLPDPQEIGAK